MYILYTIFQKAGLMSDKTRKIAKTKLIMGIIIPIIIMIGTLIMVSVSFAWFSTTAPTEVNTIDLTTTEMFVLDFTVGNTPSSSYNGQNALNIDGYLVSQYRNLTLEKPEAYMRDAPFMFVTTIGLSTQGIEVDMSVNFNFARITQVDGDFVDSVWVPSGDPYDMDIYGAASTNTGVHAGEAHEFTIDKIPYAFTWFFVEQGQTLDTATDVYTPYGTMRLGYQTVGVNNYRYATKLNGENVTDSTSIDGVTPAGLSHFSSNTIETEDEDKNKKFDFYIVFAPEELFWMQFFPADRDKAFTTVYTTQELTRYITYGTQENVGNKMYYAKTSYTGATFHFRAEINVSTIYWPED